MGPHELPHLPDVAKVDAPRLATFFACYPESIGLSDQDTQVTFTGQEMLGYAGIGAVATHLVGTTAIASLASDRLDQVFVSLRVHRASRPGSVIVRDIEDVNRVVRGLAPELAIQVPEPDERDPAFEHTYTVLELVTPLVQFDGRSWVPAPLDQSAMGLTLTRCLDVVCDLVTAYRVSTSHLMPAPARERVGPIIQWGTRPANQTDGHWDEWPDAPDSVMNGFAVLNRGLPAPEADADAVARMRGFILQRSLGFPIHAVMELQADADAAIQLRGDYRAAVMLLYSASEVFMDLALLLMCWEEGMSVEAAVAEFNPKFGARVRSKYHDRIGGGWSAKQGNVKVWQRDLVSLRHRVTHAGERVDRDAADAARDAYAGMRAHLLDRLAYSVGKYPKTAAMLVTAEGFKRRGKWSRRIEAAAASATFDVLADFVQWRNAVIQQRAAGAT